MMNSDITRKRRRTKKRLIEKLKDRSSEKLDDIKSRLERNSSGLTELRYKETGLSTMKKLPASVALSFYTAISKNSTLIHLDLSGALLLNDQVIASLLAKNTTLNVITLRNNCLKPEFFEDFFEILITNTNLITLTIGPDEEYEWLNHIGIKGIDAMTRTLIENTTLKNLSLVSLKVEPHELPYFSTALIEIVNKNKTLKFLNISYNRLSDRELLQALANNPSLTNLNLSENRFALPHVAESFKNNTNLLHLNVKYNETFTPGLANLVQNKTLLSLQSYNGGGRDLPVSVLNRIRQNRIILATKCVPLFFLCNYYHVQSYAFLIIMSYVSEEVDIVHKVFNYMNALKKPSVLEIETLKKIPKSEYTHLINNHNARALSFVGRLFHSPIKVTHHDLSVKALSSLMSNRYEYIDEKQIAEALQKEPKHSRHRLRVFFTDNETNASLNQDTTIDPLIKNLKDALKKEDVFNPLHFST